MLPVRRKGAVTGAHVTEASGRSAQYWYDPDGRKYFIRNQVFNQQLGSIWGQGEHYEGRYGSGERQRVAAHGRNLGDGFEAASSTPTSLAAVYSLSIKQPGFRTYRQDGITVGVSQAITQDVMLQVGEVTETVEVHADASMLKTESAEISTSVTPEKLSELPIDFSGAMRNPMTFLRLVPGASVSRDQSWPVTSQNGLQSFAEEIRIDGASSTNPTPGVFNEAQPSVDAIQEINSPGYLSFAPSYG